MTAAVHYRQQTPHSQILTPRQARIVCLEGPSAVGKTTLAAALNRECGAAIVPELDGRAAPPIATSASWFIDQSAARWRLARACGAAAPFAVLDGDPFKSLWYNWIYAADGWQGPDVVAPLYRSHLQEGTIGFPDLYVVLEATEPQLHHRRVGDPTRSRRNFEKHVQMIGPLRRYFAALQAAAPTRVVLVDSSVQTGLVGQVTEALRRLSSSPPDSVRLLDQMVE